jgi:hypothetical protein
VLPVDERIPALTVVAEQGLGALLARLGVEGPLDDVQLLKHHPSLRCTWGVSARRRAIVVKAYRTEAEAPKAAPGVLFDLLEELDRAGLATGRAPTVPPLVGIDRELCCYAMGRIAAPRLRDLLRGGDGDRPATLAAEWLHHTKDLTVSFGPPLGGVDLAVFLDEWATETARGDGALARLARACADALQAAPPTPRSRTLRHGRFSPYHVYDVGDGPAVVDWDTFGRGPLELDAAGYLARLARVSGSPDTAATAAERFRRAIEPIVNDATLAWYEAALLLRGAMQLTRRRPARWHERATELLGRAGWLAEG